MSPSSGVKPSFKTNISGTTSDFFQTQGGVDVKSLSSPPLPPPNGYVRFYSRGGAAYFVGPDGSEVKLLTKLNNIGLRFFGQAFDFSTPSPLSLFSVNSGDRIIEIKLIIAEEFNSPGATISVGHTGNASGLLATSDNVPQINCIFEKILNIQYGGVDAIRLFIDPSGSTRGSGSLIIVTNQGDA
jgi:hypothetical protein